MLEFFQSPRRNGLIHVRDRPDTLPGQQGTYRSRARPGTEDGRFPDRRGRHASDFDRSDDVPGPLCFKCRKRDHRVVDTDITEEDVVVWRCPACGTEGQISNWHSTFWDLSQRSPSD